MWDFYFGIGTDTRLPNMKTGREILNRLEKVWPLFWSRLELWFLCILFLVLSDPSSDGGKNPSDYRVEITFY
jgi:hypothetical protein